MRISRIWIILSSGIAGALFLAQSYPSMLVTAIESVQAFGRTPKQVAALPAPVLSSEMTAPEMVLAMSLLGLLLGAGAGSLFVKLFNRFVRWWEHIDSDNRITYLISFLMSIIITIPFVALFNQLTTFFAVLTTVMFLAVMTQLTSYALESIGEVLPWLKNKSRHKQKNYKILDTNVIIDGRVYDVIRTKFLEGQMYIPGFVLDELQHIADSQDSLRRQRGRRGLEVLRMLQSEFTLEVGTLDKVISDIGDDVDSRLVRLAKVLCAEIVTNDFNLNRVAALQNVIVLNINELAMALKPNVLPRETLEVAVIREGNHQGQGVGYLEDGTMVVIENGRDYLDTTTEVIVSQVIQTERGRMIFAEVPDQEALETPQQAVVKKRVP